MSRHRSFRTGIAALLLLALPVGCDSGRQPDPDPDGDEPPPGGALVTENALEILSKNRITGEENIRVVPIRENEDHSVNLVQVHRRVKPHYHRDHDETVYVLEGTGTFFLDDKAYETRPGTVLLIPRGARHSYTNEPPDPCAVISIFTPKFDPSDRHED